MPVRPSLGVEDLIGIGGSRQNIPQQRVRIERDAIHQPLQILRSLRRRIALLRIPLRRITLLLRRPALRRRIVLRRGRLWRLPGDSEGEQSESDSGNSDRFHTTISCFF